jgi:hypothetical protein
MKKQLIYLSILFLAFSGCDKIESDDFLISGSGNNNLDTTTFVKKILIEDFTGQTCQNCPEASNEIKTLQYISAYDGKIIAIAIHSGFFSETNNTFTTDFTTPEGDIIHDFFDIASYPKGMINRTGYPSNALLDVPEWSEKVASLIGQEPNIGIKLKKENNTIIVEAKKLNNNITGVLKLVVVITENNVIDKQLVEGIGVVEDYEHNHLLRKTLNGAWGQTIELSSEYNSFSFDYTLNDDWVESNCNVVAYIYNDQTKEIIQCEEIHLTD